MQPPVNGTFTPMNADDISATPAYDFTRLSVVGFSACSLPSMIAWQLVVIVSASSNVRLNACMCDSLFGLIPHVASKSNLIVFEFADLIFMLGRLPNMQ